MAARFESFTSLPAELRATIWHLAIRQEEGNEERTGRQIELYHYAPETATISVAISCPYPTLFAVCHEARYESAKAMDCRWVAVYARYNSPTERCQTTRLEICINFKMDTINIRARFIAPPLRSFLPLRPSPEQHRLEMFAQLLEYQTIQCIECITVDSQPPSPSCRLNFDAWWKGEGLEIFSYGRLRSISIMTTERSESSSRDYLRWLEAAVRDEVHDRWTERGQADEPRVEVLNA